MSQIAELYGIKPDTFRVYVHRKQAPPADGYHDKRTPYWLRSTLERWRTTPEPNKAAPTAGSNEGESDDEESDSE